MKLKFLHTLKIPSIGENITLVIYHFHHCVVIHHHYNCHCRTMSSSSSTSSVPSDDSDNESSDNDNQEEEQETEPTTKMSPYHAKNYLIQPWEVRIYKFYLEWQLAAILIISQITRTCCSPSRRHTTPK